MFYIDCQLKQGKRKKRVTRKPMPNCNADIIFNKCTLNLKIVCKCKLISTNIMSTFNRIIKIKLKNKMRQTQKNKKR